MRKYYGLISLLFLVSPLLSCAQTANSEPIAPAAVKSEEQRPESHATAAGVESAIPAKKLTQQERFDNWKTDFTARAIAKGYDAALVSALITPVEINAKALDRDRKQPEFTKPVWSYVDNAASADRLNKGRAKLAENKITFDRISETHPVPRHILTSIWGLETAYGQVMGNHYIPSALATFAFEGRRTAFGEAQLFALLDVLKTGKVRTEQLTGSWAGAMGMTQFIPSTFRDYAIDFDGNGNIDLWNSKADALGSAAHYLARHGWQHGEPVMVEVIVPPQFDYSVTEGAMRSVNEWSALGVKPMGGEAWSEEAGLLKARIIAPGGHRGPKLLTFKNFDVIKKYNNSTSYAMGITVLGEALRGRSVIQTPWPRSDKPLSFTDNKTMQAKLNALGYDTGGVDGQIGSKSRKAIRDWQQASGLPADGYMEQSLFKKLLAQKVN